MKTVQDVIDALSKAFPQGNFVPSEDFDGRAGGIWIRGEFDIDGRPHMCSYGAFSDYHFWVHPVLHAAAGAQGWFCEPYDNGTMMVWPA